MMRNRVGLVLICGLLPLAGASPAGAASGRATPVAGDWEGVGAHGAPLSFELVRRGGRLVATSLALGSPASCPAVPRDAEAVPLLGTGYAGPGAGQSSGVLPSVQPAVLYGQIPRSRQRVYLSGAFTTSRSGRFSIAVKQPVDNLMLSNSLRAAVTGFARTLANEVAPYGITVNNILPGYTRTERVEELARSIAAREGRTPAEVCARWEAEIPMRRLGEPREFAALAAFLVSERASYITGTSITVDGGWVKSLL